MFSSRSPIVYLCACLALYYTGLCEARSLDAQQGDFLQSMGNDQQLEQQNLNSMLQNQYQDATSNLQQQQQQPAATTANLDLEDDDDDEDRVDLQQQPQLNQAGSSQYQHEQPQIADQAQLAAAGYPSPADLKTAASKHYHHGHGAKGWLDMGAWTGKKGAFGWYDKHPVGKGK